jgi:hypothetical protein
MGWQPARSAKPLDLMTHPLLQHPRYRDNPVYYFVECLVVDIIEGLPRELQESIAQTIRTDLDGWRRKIKEISSLSETFEVAVLDLWYRNSKIASDQGDPISARDFAVLFVDNYFLEDSQIDVWGPGALETALAQIAAARAENQEKLQ